MVLIGSWWVVGSGHGVVVASGGGVATDMA